MPSILFLEIDHYAQSMEEDGDSKTLSQPDCVWAFIVVLTSKVIFIWKS